MEKLTKDSLIDNVPSYYARKLIGDFYDVLRYLDNNELEQSTQSIEKLDEEGKTFCEVNGLYFIDQLKD